MRNITISIDDQVHLACSQLINDRKLSPTINELLKTFLKLESNEFFAEKESLLSEEAQLTKRLGEVSTKLMILKRREQENMKQARQETLNLIDGIKLNNPLRDLV